MSDPQRSTRPATGPLELERTELTPQQEADFLAAVQNIMGTTDVENQEMVEGAGAEEQGQ